MEKEIKEYYSRFKEIYNKENYPRWFEHQAIFNQQFDATGYDNNKKIHTLGHWAILQNQIPEKIEIVMVGKNNSWFDKKDMSKALEIVREIEEDIPTQDHHLQKSNFANKLNATFKKVGKQNKRAEEILRSNRVGINRIWVQTGTSLSSNVDIDLINQCTSWTKEIIRLLNPKLVLLFGREEKFSAWELFDDYEQNEKFAVRHCWHPVGNKTGLNPDIILGGMKDQKANLI